MMPVQREAIAHAPLAAGVYRFRDDTGQVLYVGKARRLRLRLKSYFTTNSSWRTIELMRRAHSVDWTVATSETEALLMEQHEISESQPPFNIRWKDDKTFPYLRIEGGDWPRIQMTRKPTGKPTQLFGPYANVGLARRAMSDLCATFGLRTCRDTEFRNRSRPCLEYQIGRCSAPCVGKVTVQEYGEAVGHAKRALRGQIQSLVDVFSKRMEESAQSQRYEVAGTWRDRIVALRSLAERQGAVAGHRTDNADVFVVRSDRSGHPYIAEMSVRSGHVVGHLVHRFASDGATPESDDNCIEQFLWQRYARGRAAPARRVVARFRPSAELVDYLYQRRGANVHVSVGMAGRPARWAALCAETARGQVAQMRSQGTYVDGLASLGRVANVPSLDRVMGTDASQTLRSEMCVSFVQVTASGEDRRSRRVIVESAEGGDPNVMGRAVERAVRANIDFPPVIVVDGGGAQMAAVRKHAAAVGWHGTLCGVIKGVNRRSSQDRFVLWTPDTQEPAHFEPSQAVMQLLQAARDAAHNAANRRARQRAESHQRQSPLDLVKGLGASRRVALLRHFGGLKGLRYANEQALRQVPGIGPELARRIIDAVSEGGSTENTG